MQRTAIDAGSDLLIGPFRLCQGQFLCQSHNALQRRSVLFQAAEVHLGQSRGRNPACADEFGKFSHGVKCQLLQILRHGRYFNGAPPDRLFLKHDKMVNGKGVKLYCRGNMNRQRQLPYILVACQIFSQGFHHEGPLTAVEFQPCQLFSLPHSRHCERTFIATMIQYGCNNYSHSRYSC